MAERFLQLTPDEIYELAHSASHVAEGEPGQRAPGSLSPAVPEVPAGPAIFRSGGSEAESFRRIVEMVTEALTREMRLPDFEAWRSAYEARPEDYEEDLLGLWRESL